MPNVYAGGRRARIKLEESQAGSASIGGFSTVESLQENEEKISTENKVKAKTFNKQLDNTLSC
mgnify:FL=1